MILVLVPVIIMLLIILITIANKIEFKNKRIAISVVITNILIITFFRFIFPAGSKYAELTIYFWINIALNIIILIVLCNKKIKINNIITSILIIIYFIFMFMVPTYKLEGHRHEVINGRESIIEYKDYYNLYSMRLVRK